MVDSWTNERRASISTVSVTVIHIIDYYSIKTISKIKNINNDQIRRAHIAAYFGRQDEAEDLFRAEDRIDLATEHRKLLGKNRALLLVRIRNGFI